MGKGYTKAKLKGVDELIEQLEPYTDPKKVVGCEKHAIWGGAAVMYEAMREATEALPVVPYASILRAFQKRGTPVTGVSQWQKEGLIESLGISSMRTKAGVIYNRVGYAGYNHQGRAVKGGGIGYVEKGQPNIEVARAVDVGTTANKATHFASKAISKAKKKAETEMVKLLDDSLANLQKG